MAQWHSLSDWLTVGELSRRSGVAVSALRYYEQLGLIAAERTTGNQRRYPRHMLRRVSLVAVSSRLGVPLADVLTALAEVPLDLAPSQSEWQRASHVWKEMLEERRRTLESLQRELTGCIGCGCLSLRSCALLNPDDELGAEGPGARRIGRGGDPVHRIEEEA